MSYIVIEDFKGGLDTRKMDVTSPVGSLQTLQNAHISRGGEIEKSKSFVETFTDLDGTFGFASVNEDLYVFGSGTRPVALPAGLEYQRLQNGAGDDLEKVVSVDLFAGKLYVIADFSDGKRYRFNDGVLVGDWVEGVARDPMTSNDDIAEELKDLIDAHPDYTATRTGATITINGTDSDAFEISGSASNGEGNTFNDQLVTITEVQAASGSGTVEVLATGSFRVTGGTASAGVNKISSVKVDGIEILSVAVDWSGSNTETAEDVAVQINSYASTPEYTATADAGVVTISAVAGSGSTPNTKVVSVTVAGDVTVADITNMAGGVDASAEVLATGSINITGGTAATANGVATIQVNGVDVLGASGNEVLATSSFTITGGTSNPGVNKVNSVTVNGVDILGAAVNWGTSHAATATAVAAQITSFTSSPNYTASAVGADVTITAPVGSGSTPNGHVVVVNVGGDVTASAPPAVSGGLPNRILWTTSHSNTALLVANQINAHTSVPNYTATVDNAKIIISAVAGSGDSPNGFVVSSTVSGNVTTGSALNMAGGVDSGSSAQQINNAAITGTFELGDKFTITIGGVVFGADRVAGLQATGALKVHKNKVYEASDSTLLFSGVGEPTAWNSDNDGSGATDMSTQASGFQEVTALGVYQNNLAIFSRRAIQVWFVDPDPGGNSQLQVLNNIGTQSRKSVVSFGDSDVFFLADTGVRSLKARDSSNAAAVSDVGTPIDTLIVADMKGLTQEQIKDAAGVIEPTDGRFILSLGEKMYVFSYFSSSKVSSWSTYEKGLSVSDWAIAGNKVYARATNEDDEEAIYLLGGDDGETYDDDESVIVMPYVSARKQATWKRWTGFDIACEGEWDVYVNTDPENPDTYEKIGTVYKKTFNLMKWGMIANAPMIKFKFVSKKPEYARIGALVLHFESTKDD